MIKLIFSVHSTVYVGGSRRGWHRLPRSVGGRRHPEVPGRPRASAGTILCSSQTGMPTNAIIFLFLFRHVETHLSFIVENRAEYTKWIGKHTWSKQTTRVPAPQSSSSVSSAVAKSLAAAGTSHAGGQIKRTSSIKHPKSFLMNAINRDSSKTSGGHLSVPGSPALSSRSTTTTGNWNQCGMIAIYAT